MYRDRVVEFAALASALLRARGKFDAAIAAAQLVIALNPGEPWAYKEVGLSMMYRGRTDDALEWFNNAERTMDLARRKGANS